VHTYSLGGSDVAVAVRSSLSGGGTDYLFGDAHGTATLAMDTTTQQVSRQQYTPYGQQRANANGTAWPDPTHSYLGKSQEAATGYTDVGVRKYDPVLGRFISADPKFEPTNPQELGGYTYSGDNPVTNADPSGQMYEAGDIGGGPYRPPTDATDWLFRGSTKGFTGSENIQSTGFTPTSSDPGVHPFRRAGRERLARARCGPHPEPAGPHRSGGDGQLRTLAGAAPLYPLPEPITERDQRVHLDVRRPDRADGVLREYQHAA
jgi:RHS repeat-associated protein